MIFCYIFVPKEKENCSWIVALSWKPSASRWSNFGSSVDCSLRWRKLPQSLWMTTIVHERITTEIAIQYATEPARFVTDSDWGIGILSIKRTLLIYTNNHNCKGKANKTMLLYCSKFESVVKCIVNYTFYNLSYLSRVKK